MKQLFEIHSTDKIMAAFEVAVPLSEYARAKLSVLRADAMEVIALVDTLQRLVGHELSCEVVFENDRGDDLYTQTEKFEKDFLQIARNGQGDAWLLHLTENTIYFFDHGSESVGNMKIDFWQFLQLADLMAQYEDCLNREEKSKEAADDCIRCMRLLREDLPGNYPFDL